MLHIASHLIVISNLLQPSINIPQKSIHPFFHKTSHKESLPFKSINSVITSEDMLYHILQERNNYETNQEWKDNK